MRAAAGLLLLAAIVGLAVPREVVRTRCVHPSVSCLEDDLGAFCISNEEWVTRDIGRGADVLERTCRKAWMRRWLGIEWFDRNVDGRPR